MRLLNVLLDDLLIHSLQRLANEKGVSRSQYIRNALYSVIVAETEGGDFEMQSAPYVPTGTDPAVMRFNQRMAVIDGQVQLVKINTETGIIEGLFTE